MCIETHHAAIFTLVPNLIRSRLLKKKEVHLYKAGISCAWFFCSFMRTELTRLSETPPISWSRRSPVFVVPESSLPCPQGLTYGSYAEPDKSRQQYHTAFLRSRFISTRRTEFIWLRKGTNGRFFESGT
jgi:hypothetical protein